MAYNLSVLDNSTGIVDVAKAANGFTGGLLGILIIVIICLAIYFGLRFENPKNAFVAASFVAAILSILFRIIGLVNDYVPVVCILLVIGAFALMIQKQ
jgi:hypothetical protein